MARTQNPSTTPVECPAVCRNLLAKARDPELVDATAAVTITGSEILVRYHKRAHNPPLIAAGFVATDTMIPWLGGRRLRLLSGSSFMLRRA